MNIVSKSVSGSALSNGSFPNIKVPRAEIRTNLFNEQRSLRFQSTEAVLSSIANATAQPTMTVKSFFTPSVSPVEEATPSSIPFADLTEREEKENEKEEEENAEPTSSQASPTNSQEESAVSSVDHTNGVVDAADTTDTTDTADTTDTSDPSISVTEEEGGEEEEESPSSQSASSPAFRSNTSLVYRPPSDYQTRLQRLLAARPHGKYNYLMDIPALLDSLLRRPNASLAFRRRGSLASVLAEFGPALYHRCRKHAVEYSFCQYHWLVAWDSDSREFYPFHEQKRPDFWNS